MLEMIDAGERERERELVVIWRMRCKAARSSLEQLAGSLTNCEICSRVDKAKDW